LYEVTVDNELEIAVDPKSPRRGRSAFQTDLCLFERRKSGVELPRVVLEFKTSITTHDVLTYSAKAKRHKQVYPYLRYGIVASREDAVPRRFFLHNEALDFCLTLSALSQSRRRHILGKTLKQEVAASRRLETTAYGAKHAVMFRSVPQFESA
jgi:hypothetical protein